MSEPACQSVRPGLPPASTLVSSSAAPLPSEKAAFAPIVLPPLGISSCVKVEPALIAASMPSQPEQGSCSSSVHSSPFPSPSHTSPMYNPPPVPSHFAHPEIKREPTPQSQLPQRPIPSPLSQQQSVGTPAQSPLPPPQSPLSHQTPSQMLPATAQLQLGQAPRTNMSSTFQGLPTPFNTQPASGHHQTAAAQQVVQQPLPPPQQQSSGIQLAHSSPPTPSRQQTEGYLNALAATKRRSHQPQTAQQQKLATQAQNYVRAFQQKFGERGKLAAANVQSSRLQQHHMSQHAANLAAAQNALPMVTVRQGSPGLLPPSQQMEQNVQALRGSQPGSNAPSPLSLRDNPSPGPPTASSGPIAQRGPSPLQQGLPVQVARGNGPPFRGTAQQKAALLQQAQAAAAQQQQAQSASLQQVLSSSPNRSLPSASRINQQVQQTAASGLPLRNVVANSIMQHQMQGPPHPMVAGPSHPSTPLPRTQAVAALFVGEDGVAMNSKEEYRTLKRKFKYLVYENECYQEELRNLQRKLLKLSRDKNFLLDRLMHHEKLSDSSDDDSDSSVRTQVDERPKPKKKSRPNRKRTGTTSGPSGSIAPNIAPLSSSVPGPSTSAGPACSTPHGIPPVVPTTLTAVLQSKRPPPGGIHHMHQMMAQQKALRERVMAQQPGPSNPTLVTEGASFGAPPQGAPAPTPQGLPQSSPSLGTSCVQMPPQPPQQLSSNVPDNPFVPPTGSVLPLNGCLPEAPPTELSSDPGVSAQISPLQVCTQGGSLPPIGLHHQRPSGTVTEGSVSQQGPGSSQSPGELSEAEAARPPRTPSSSVQSCPLPPVAINTNVTLVPLHQASSSASTSVSPQNSETGPAGRKFKGGLNAGARLEMVLAKVKEEREMSEAKRIKLEKKEAEQGRKPNGNAVPNGGSEHHMQHSPPADNLAPALVGTGTPSTAELPNQRPSVTNTAHATTTIPHFSVELDVQPDINGVKEEDAKG